MAIKLVKNNGADIRENNISKAKVAPSNKEQAKIPPALMLNIHMLLWGIVVCAICILFGINSFGAISFLAIIGLILIAILGAYAAILYRTYSTGNYDYVDGICIAAHKAGWRKQYWQIIIADNENNTYSVNIIAKRKHRIFPGDKVIVYVPKGLEITENDNGIYEINELYGFMRHR